MFKKIVKKIAMGALALTCVFGCVGTFTACDEGNPEAQITLEFNEQEYVLYYQLYKDKTPKTVNHFIWLVENNYYDGLCIHDYQASKKLWYTGAYSLDDNGDLERKDYQEFASARLDSFPQTVWEDSARTKPLYTLFGEFKDNHYSVNANNKDVLKQGYGTLSMYYEEIEDEENVKVWVTNSKGEVIDRDYEPNSATSMFYISTVTSSTTKTAYCTFATLNNTDTLESLEDAIADYIGDEDNDWFVIDTKDTQNENIEYDLPREPITVKSIRMTKY